MTCWFCDAPLTTDDDGMCPVPSILDCWRRFLDRQEARNG